MSTLRGLPLISAHVHIPPSGCAWAELVASQGTAPDLGPAVLVVGDLALTGAVIRSGEDDPDKPTAIFTTGAGWGSLLTRAGAYDAPGGVKLSTVLRDLAALVGETYDAPATDALLPAHFEWPASTASNPVRADAILAELVTLGALPTWRIDPPTGRTRFDAWPSIGAADRAVQVVKRDLRRGWRRLGLDRSVSACLPGATIEGVTIARLHVHDTAGALTAEAWNA